MDIRIEPVSEMKKKDFSNLRFGEKFTDRMFVMEYDKGWCNARIEKFHDFPMSPATMVFHYAQAIFEGMKAFAYKGGKAAVFRPEENFIRLNNSADRLCMPKTDVPFVMKALTELIRLERDWVPQGKGTSLYIRPTMIGVDPIIKVRASDSYLFFIIMSPVGPYFSSVSRMSKIMVEEKYVRAVRGGIGEAKAAANYAASIRAGMEAARLGYDQTLWLDALERKYIEEVGSMNLFFVINDVITTPELTGSILPGITRKSLIHLARHLGFKVEERHITIDEVIEGLTSGRVTEVFGSGTACVVNPVGVLGYKGKEYIVGGGKIGKYSETLYNYLTGIQYGEKEDMFGWMVVL